MKKIVLLGLSLLALQFNVFGQDQIITINELPAKAQSFLKEHFKDDGVAYAKKDAEIMSTTYDVILTSGCKVEFYSSGDWESVECKGSKVPNSIVPNKIGTYVKTNYPEARLVEISKERSGFDVELSNDVDLKFNKSGKLTKIDL